MEFDVLLVILKLNLFYSRGVGSVLNLSTCSEFSLFIERFGVTDDL